MSFDRLKLVWLCIALAAFGAMNYHAQSGVVVRAQSDSLLSQQAINAEATNASESGAKSSARIDQSLFAPEIWRLPPVGDSVVRTPPALAMPPMLGFAAPPSTAAKPANPSEPPADLPADEPAGDASDKPEPGPRLLELKSEHDGELEKPWSGSFDLGLDGSEGNSETLNFHFGFHGKRKVESNVLSLDLDYNKRSAEDSTTANRLFFDGRWEWFVPDTPRTWFVHQTVEYDEFQPFNVRDTSDAGVGYRLIRKEMIALIGRLGGGFSHEYGGPENGVYVPEVVFGLQAEYQFNKRQKVLGSAEYAPDLGNFGHYRIRSQAALEALLDEERNLSMRIGVLERYNSKSNGAKPNDLDYAVMLMWKF